PGIGGRGFEDHADSNIPAEPITIIVTGRIRARGLGFLRKRRNAAKTSTQPASRTAPKYSSRNAANPNHFVAIDSVTASARAASTRSLCTGGASAKRTRRQRAAQIPESRTSIKGATVWMDGARTFSTATTRTTPNAKIVRINSFLPVFRLFGRMVIITTP